MIPRSRYASIPGHEIHLMEWGNPDAPALVLWHGLARTGRDFDELAAGLADRWRVICPDTIGRGLSTWADDPKTEYCSDAYATQALALLDALQIERTAWLGTSMGGLIGMRIASGPDAARLTALIVNDIGPELPKAAEERIVTYAACPPIFERMTEAEAWLRRAYAPFGPAPESFWRRMAECSIRRKGDGSLTVHYDPAIVDQFRLHPEDFHSWDRYARITTPMHLIRGARSDLLTEEIAARMLSTGPKPGLRLFPDCGHAPSLVSGSAIAEVARVLEALTARSA